MSAFKGSKFDERREASADAKKALLEKFRARPAPNDPAMLARQAELKAIEDAREVRAEERRRLKQLELERLAAEERARQEAEAERQRELARQAAEEVARKKALEAEQKAARDLRYAKRKARR